MWDVLRNGGGALVSVVMLSPGSSPSYRTGLVIERGHHKVAHPLAFSSSAHTFRAHPLSSMS